MFVQWDRHTLNKNRYGYEDIRCNNGDVIYVIDI